MPNVHLQLPPGQGFRLPGRPEHVAGMGNVPQRSHRTPCRRPGQPVFEPPALIGEVGASTRLGGYSIVTADDLEAAVSMAKRCPTVEREAASRSASLLSCLRSTLRSRSARQLAGA